MKGKAYDLPGSNGKGVLLIHGLTGAPIEMRPIAKLLQRAGYTVHVPLLAGHCAGSAALLRTGWRDWYASVDAARARLAGEVGQVYVGGICAGAALALLLARRRPEIAGVAAYSMTFRYDGWAMPNLAWAADLIQLFAGLPGLRALGFAERDPFGLKDEALRARVAKAQSTKASDMLDIFPLGALRELYRLGRHVAREAPGIAAPTLIVHARDDDMSSLANAVRLRSLLGGPAELHVLEDSYHMIHVDREHTHVAALTADFFGAPRLAAMHG